MNHIALIICNANRWKKVNMQLKYTVVNTYSPSTDAQKEKLKADASRAVYRELLRCLENKTEQSGQKKTA